MRVMIVWFASHYFARINQDLQRLGPGVIRSVIVKFTHDLSPSIKVYFDRTPPETWKATVEVGELIRPAIYFIGSS